MKIVAPAARLGGALLALAGAGLLASGCATPTEPRFTSFQGWKNFETFQRVTNGNGVTLTSPRLKTGGAWRELIVSWNASCPPGAHLRAEARGFHAGRPTKFYTLGLWSEDTAGNPRESVKGQRDGDGTVLTDTLVVRQPMEEAQIRITLSGAGENFLPRLKFAGASFLGGSGPSEKVSARPVAWGEIIDVPQRAQTGHPGAKGWCSPACVSMLLAHWAKVLHRSELDVPVPQVAAGVQDRNLPGTGNWVFNTAFAGKFEGMRAVVTRFDDVSEIEEWVAAGIPVAVSVSFDFLNGRPVDDGNGHLIVVVGFTGTGDVVVNDPWPNPKKENTVRKVFPRQNLVKAWERSRRAVYLICPETMKVPENRRGHWAD